MNAEFRAVELRLIGLVVLPEDVCADIAREVVPLELERINDARYDRGARRLVPLANLSDDSWSAELGSE